MDSVEQVLARISQNAAAANPPAAGDYIAEDELLYCGVCKTAKQCWVGICGKLTKQTCLCACRKDQYDREEAAFRQRMQTENIQRMRQIGFLRSEMQQWTFANDKGYNPKILNAMRRYVENFAEVEANGKGLLLYGTPGNGKSFAAACVTNALIDKGIPCVMTSFGQVAVDLQSAFGDQKAFYDDLNRYSLVVLDDLGTERRSAYMDEIVFNIIDRRIRANRPMIITTNLTWEALKNPSDVMQERIFSRILGACHPVKVEGDDLRKKSLVEGFTAMNRLLELA